MPANPRHRVPTPRSAVREPVPPSFPAQSDEPQQGLPDTPAAKALCTALARHDEAVTVAELAITAGIGRSTAAKLLMTLEAAGFVTRQPGGRDHGTRQPDRWIATTLLRNTVAPLDGPASADVTEAAGPATRGAATARQSPLRLPATSTDATTTSAEASSDSTAPPEVLTAGDDATLALDGSADPAAGAPTQRCGEKLARGELREQVRLYLAERPGQDFTPGAIAMAIHRSAGAVTNACRRLAVLGDAIGTSTAPRRYRAAQVQDTPAP
jgi:IclR helix-turn-helix domain